MEEIDMKITKEQLKAIMPNSRRMLFGYLCHQGMPCCIVVLSCGNNRIVRQEEMVALGGDRLFAKRVCRCIVNTAVLTEKLILRIIEMMLLSFCLRMIKRASPSH